MIFLGLKNKSKEYLLKLYRRLVIMFNPILNTGTINKQFTDLNKDELLTKLNNIKNKLSNKEAIKVLNESNVFTTDEEMEAYKKFKIESKKALKQYRKEQQKEKKLLKMK